MTMKNLKPIVDLLINDLDNTHRHRDQFVTHAQYVREFRTISLNTPRQTGKTTVLLQMLHQHNSLMFTRTHAMRRHVLQRLGWGGGETTAVEPIFTFNDGERFANRLGEIYPRDPIECILVDEIGTSRYWLWQLIELLAARNMLTDDFFVLMLGTD